MKTPQIETRIDADGRRWFAYELPTRDAATELEKPGTHRRDELEAIRLARLEIEKLMKVVDAFRAN